MVTSLLGAPFYTFLERFSSGAVCTWQREEAGWIPRTFAGLPILQVESAGTLLRFIVCVPRPWRSPPLLQTMETCLPAESRLVEPGDLANLDQTWTQASPACSQFKAAGALP